jgi:hypothetical protein
MLNIFELNIFPKTKGKTISDFPFKKTELTRISVLVHHLSKPLPSHQSVASSHTRPICVALHVAVVKTIKKI